MELRIGDRFEGVDAAIIWEYTGDKWLCLQAFNGFKYGELQGHNDMLNLHDDPDQWKFVGNFSKSHNYNDLYELLNGN